MKRFILSIIAVAVAWSILDFITHSLLLAPVYKQTASLWRPEAEMKMWLMNVVTLLSAIFFSAIYYYLIEKSLKNGVLYGLLFGLATGISMGYGTYTFMPIPYSLALSWFLSSVVNCVVAGALLGLILKEEQ